MARDPIKRAASREADKQRKRLRRQIERTARSLEAQGTSKSAVKRYKKQAEALVRKTLVKHEPSQERRAASFSEALSYTGLKGMGAGAQAVQAAEALRDYRDSKAAQSMLEGFDLFRLKFKNHLLADDEESSKRLERGFLAATSKLWRGAAPEDRLATALERYNAKMKAKEGEDYYVRNAQKMMDEIAAEVDVQRRSRLESQVGRPISDEEWDEVAGEESPYDAWYESVKSVLLKM